MRVQGVIIDNDYRLNGCYVEITSKCNLRCLHCYNASGELREQLSLETFKNLLGCYETPKEASITLSGGEPLLHPHIWNFVDMIIDSGFLAENILLITNATCITDDIAEKLAGKHISVQVSLNGSKPEFHDAVCGRGNFDRTMAGLQRLLAKKSNMVIVRNMVNKQNIDDDWDAFFENLINMGVHKILLAGLKKVGRASDNLSQISLNPSEYQQIIDKFNASQVIKKINDTYRKEIGTASDSNVRISVPLNCSPSSGQRNRILCLAFKRAFSSCNANSTTARTRLSPVRVSISSLLFRAYIWGSPLFF